MPALNDNKLATLQSLTNSTGSLPGLEHKWLSSVVYPYTGTIPDMWMRFFLNNGIVGWNISDMMFKYLTNNGYTSESLSDKLAKAWADGTAFSGPPSIFTNSEPGVWFDPSDLTTLYQDSAGTTPVAAAGQPVGLMLDKSKGLVLGSQLVTNGDFSNGTTGWTVGGGWSISGGAAVAANSSAMLSQSGVFTSGKWYKLTIRQAYTNGTLQIRINGVQSVGFVSNLGTGSWSYTFLATASGQLEFNATSYTGSIDDISVRELAGNHATGSSTTRPTYAIAPKTGRRNLLTYTEQFDNAAWTKSTLNVTQNSDIAPDGTTTADLLVPTTTGGSIRQTLALVTNTAYRLSLYVKAGTSARSLLALWDDTAAAFLGQLNIDWTAGVPSQSGISGSATNATFVSVGSGWYRVSVTITSAALTTSHRFFFYPDVLVGTGTTIAWGAQLETGSSATAYQKVVSQYEVTEAGVPSLSCLNFDGIDDFMLTGTITPGTDKVQVFAGVRKLSDVAGGIVVESSANSGSNAGAFGLFAPNTTNTYGFRSRGSITVSPLTSSSTYVSPITNVVSGIAEISTDLNNLRINGAQVASTTSDQGADNFLAYPLYIGRRAGTSLPFNGNLYGLIVRFGPNLSDPKISTIENWMNMKTGAY